MQTMAGYTKGDHRRNADILEKLKIKPVIDYIHNYQRKWNTWAKWIQEGSQNIFNVISQEGKHQSGIQWRDGM